MDKFLIQKLPSKLDINKDILNIDSSREQMTSSLKIGILCRNKYQNTLYEIIEKSMHPIN
jgi:hypothetical protein